jgi:hypothetical protein
MSEKVNGGNGKWYTKNHPHEIISPYVMRFEEIRGWLKELSTNPEYGWTPGGVSGLMRALGMTPGSLKRKLTVGWIWPKEQVRLTARIKEILDGHIVPKRFGQRVEGAYVDPPVPPNVAEKPRSIAIRIVPGKGVSFRAQDCRPPPRLPSFARAFSEAIEWNTDKK